MLHFKPKYWFENNSHQIYLEKYVGGWSFNRAREKTADKFAAMQGLKDVIAAQNFPQKTL